MSETENKKNMKQKAAEPKDTTKNNTAKVITTKTAEAKNTTSKSKASTKETATKVKKVQPKVTTNAEKVEKPNKTNTEKNPKLESKTKVEEKTKKDNKVKTENKAKVINEEKTENKPNAKKTVKKEEKTEVKKVEKKPEIEPKEEKNTEKEDTVSLKEIREALENKINNNQKHSIIKENIINIMVAVVIILYLIIVFVGSKNIQTNTLEIVLKVFSMCFAVIGLIILEIAYKKDNLKILFCGGEILIFGAVNLCMMYVAKLYPANLLNVTTYISIAVAVYYLGKVVVLTVRSIKKYKKDNSDIKEIIKK